MEIEQVSSKEELLKNSLKSLLLKDELVFHKGLISRLAVELDISILDCAAALSLLKQPDVGLNIEHTVKNLEEVSNDLHGVVVPTFKQKVVRYRLDVGRKHLVSTDDIKSVLIEVSGVDKNRIGKLDIRNYYSLVDLPEGMPADIFQLLADVEINRRKLNLKRVKYQPRFYRRNNKKRQSQKPYAG